MLVRGRVLGSYQSPPVGTRSWLNSPTCLNHLVCLLIATQFTTSNSSQAQYLRLGGSTESQLLSWQRFDGNSMSISKRAGYALRVHHTVPQLSSFERRLGNFE